VTTKGSYKTRPLQWEDEASDEPRFRRVQQGVPPSGRVLPGMPLEMADPDGDGPPRFRGPQKPWWRPSSTTGRVFFATCALIVLGSFATAAILLKHSINRDARFRIAGASNIEATGLIEVSRTEMLPVFGEDIGRNIFFVPLSERRKQLEEIPWVERATVMRLLPDQIRVSVVERQPVAFTRQGSQIGLVDASGVLLDMPPATMARHHYSFPVLTGIDPGDPPASRKARVALYERLVEDLDTGSQHLSEQISEIDLTDPEDARVRMPEQGTDILAHFGEDHFLERYQRYKAHIAEWRQQYPKLAAVDLRYEQQVVLEMSHGGNAVEATPASAMASEPKASGPAPTPAAEKAKPAAGITNASVKAAEPVRPAPKPVSKSASKSKSASAQALAAKMKKKREAAQRAAANAKKHKPATPNHSAAAAQGQ
jgi:cell division protein FtsQ